MNYNDFGDFPRIPFDKEALDPTRANLPYKEVTQHKSVEPFSKQNTEATQRRRVKPRYLPSGRFTVR